MNGNFGKMNPEIQKKWFIYIGDHHEGPFSIEEMSARQKAGQVKSESYVWCEGMADWQVLSSVTELDLELKKREQTAPEKSKTATQTSSASVSDSKPKNRAKRALTGIGVLIAIGVLSIGGLSVLSRFGSDDIHAAIRPLIVNAVDRFPMLSGLFKLVPNLSDIRPEQQVELEDAQVGLPDTGVKLAFALSQSDPSRPFFYISTNLPDRAKIDFYLIGNGETLLNRLQFSTHATVVTHHGFAKTDVFSADGGQPLPKGEYRVFVTESADQIPALQSKLEQFPPNKIQMKLPEGIPSDHRFLFAKTVFLGGARDETYLTRLKAFHEKVAQNAEKEVVELKQYSDTLQLQLATLTNGFSKLKGKKPTPRNRQAWKKSTETWEQINAQLDQTIQTWSDETLQNEFFYGKIYGLVKSAYGSVKSLFALENSYFESKPPLNPGAFDIQYGKTLSETRDAIDLLRNKVDLILKAPKTTSGLPTREGL